MQGSNSEPDFVSAVRKAASEAASVPSVSAYSSRHSRSRRSGSEASLRRGRGGKSRGSRSSDWEEEGFTLEQQQKAVQDAAFERYLKTLQKDAKQAVVDGYTWTATVNGGLNEEQQEKVRRRELAQKNQNQIREQMENNKSRRAETRREFIEAASLHSFPLFTETFISLPEVEEYERNQKIQWKKELDNQIVTNKMLHNIETKKFQDAAAEAYVQNVKNMTKSRKAERKKFVNQGKELVGAWERDIRLKDLKKSIEVGKDVVKELDQPTIMRKK